MTKKILLVEDNQINAKLIKDFLLHQYYDVIMLHSGLDVYSVTKAEKPDLILMDIQLFGMSGVEAAKQIKNDPDLQKIPIIAVSAFSREKLEKEHADSYFADYIEKPITFDIFSKAINKNLGS